jgi:mannose-6-phosphate isomerase-like protein (cupin superfamily)
MKRLDCFDYSNQHSPVSAIHTIQANGRTLALIGKRSRVDGIQFVTQPSDPFQVGIMERKKGYRVEAHRHPDRPITVESVSEFFFIESGKVRLTIFDDAWNAVASEVVDVGEFALILSGGHSVEFLEDTRMHEVKQGPYPGDKVSKEFLRAIA